MDMDNDYDEKQYYRQKELKSRRDSHKIDEQQYKKPGNKRLKLVRSMMDDFHPDKSRYSIPCTEIPPFRTAISMFSDDGIGDYIEYQEMIAEENENQENNMFSATTMETTINEIPDIANLADWVTTDNKLFITPLDQRHKNYHSMENKCRTAEPVADTTILCDLQRAFNHPSSSQLFEMTLCCMTLPYWISSDNGEITETASKFMAENKLTKSQLFRVSDICKNILYRSSYGVLFLRDNKFFAKINHHIQRRRSAIKGYSILKPNGEWENPWETTVRIIKHDVEYWKNEEWQSFDMNEHIEEDERRTYLECLVASVKAKALNRYIGMFIIHLKPNIQIRIKDSRQVDIEGNWYPIDINEDRRSKFYTIDPFLQYLQEHRDVA